MPKKDQIYTNPELAGQKFRFNQAVAEVFDDMIRRSVPGYEGIIEQIAALASRLAQPNSVIYDLGSSLGATSLAIRRKLTDTTVRIKAVDNSAAMIERSRILLDAYQSDIVVDLLQQDIRETEIHNASLVIMNFTLQFVPLADREALIAKIYQGMLPGAAVVISEKIDMPSPEINALIRALHEDFKRERGYSELEISQKRDALQDVLVPETLVQHELRLKQAGFEQVALWYQHYNFCSMLAVK